MTKKCLKCGIEKDLSEFPKDRSRNTGYYSSCKKCCATRSKEWAKNNKDKIKQISANWYNRNRTWHITKQTAPIVLSTIAQDHIAFHEDCKKQNGICAICQQSKRLVYDHDHATGRYRGAICHSCNHLLGYAYDNPNTLQAAIGYLASRKKPPLE